MMLPDPTREEILHVCENLREQSHREIFSVTDLTPDGYATGLHLSDGFKWVGYADGQPAAILGASRLHGGVWGFYGFGTDAWGKIWRSVTKTALNSLFPAVKAAGWHRAHCLALADQQDVLRWLEFLGATVESTMRGYGRNGEDYVMLVWAKE